MERKRPAPGTSAVTDRDEKRLREGEDVAAAGSAREFPLLGAGVGTAQISQGLYETKPFDPSRNSYFLKH
jgi:hypothetical protein